MTEGQPPRSKVVRLIHGAIFTGMAMVGVVAAIVRSRPDAPAPSMSPMMSLVFTGLGAVAISLSLVVFRPRVSNRGSDESPDAYWTPARHTAALVTWAVIEAGGLIGVVGYFLTGMWAPLGLVLIALVAGFMTRPGVFENR